jgi:DNA-directed RNA polymerase subunit RPC12/RpoP
MLHRSPSGAGCDRLRLLRLRDRGQEDLRRHLPYGRACAQCGKPLRLHKRGVRCDECDKTPLYTRHLAVVRSDADDATDGLREAA